MKKPTLLGPNKTRVVILVVSGQPNKHIEVSVQELNYNNRECQVLLCRDVSKLKQNAKLSAENKMLTLYTSTMSHELLTPLRCIKQVATDAAHNAPEVKSDLSLIVNSTDLLLNQVKGNLDKELLENDMFEPNLDESNLKEVVDNVLGIL